MAEQTEAGRKASREAANEALRRYQGDSEDQAARFFAFQTGARWERERAKRPDREQIETEAHQYEILSAPYGHSAHASFAAGADWALHASSPTLADVSREGPTAEELLDTRAGLALANAAWSEGVAQQKRAQEVQDAGEGWHKPVSPYSAPLLARIKAEGPRTTPEAREITDAEVRAAYSAFVQTSFGFPGAPAMRAALEAARQVSRG